MRKIRTIRTTEMEWILIWTMIPIIILWCAWEYEITYPSYRDSVLRQSMYHLIFITRWWPIFPLMITSGLITDILRDTIVLKYKMEDNGFRGSLTRKLKVKYLTSYWLFIPYWRSIEHDYHSCEAQNIFGAKMNIPYSTPKTYGNNEIAIDIIERHKQKVKKNRIELFKRKKSNKRVKYFDR